MPESVYVCGGDFRPGPRGECPDRLHDWPLPAGYVEASEAAARRIGRKWTCKRCARCGLYGWEPGKLGEGDVRVPAPSPEADEQLVRCPDCGESLGAPDRDGAAHVVVVHAFLCEAKAASAEERPR